MDKNLRFEKVRFYAVSSYIVMSLIYINITNYFISFNNFKRSPFGGVILSFSFTILYNLIRYYSINTVKYKSDRAFIIFGCIDLFNVSYYFDVPALDQGGKVVIMFILIISGINRGRKIGTFLTLLWFPIKMVSDFLFMNLIREPGRPDFHYMTRIENIIDAVYFQIMLVILVFITNVIYREIVKKEKENILLLSELAQRYEELTAAHDEIEVQYDMLRKANTDLEVTNEKLAYSIGEFYTLQQVSQAIGSILDMDELMRFVNDITLGVMGVKASTIILYNEKIEKLEVHTTNISDNENYFKLINTVNSKVLFDILYKGIPFYENNVDSNKFIFTKGRNVGSIICVPLSSKMRKYGLILIEQDFQNAFDDDKLRLLTIIGQQVSMAMENADLYQKMHELAVRDNLTGIYNRRYFHERLEAELKQAKENGYEGSLVMFDIDYFKKFNDTYGHLFGDKVLKDIADLVGNFIRNKDVFARIGGEEFIILLPNTSLSQAYEISERLRKKIENTTISDDNVYANVTASFGISCFPQSFSNITELLRNADKALYEAKESGRNCVKVAF